MRTFRSKKTKGIPKEKNQECGTVDLQIKKHSGKGGVKERSVLEQCLLTSLLVTKNKKRLKET